jgi:hypothetical protein
MLRAIEQLVSGSPGGRRRPPGFVRFPVAGTSTLDMCALTLVPSSCTISFYGRNGEDEEHDEDTRTASTAKIAKILVNQLIA